MGGSNLRSVAISSYRSSRYDVFAVDTSGSLLHRIYEGDWWPGFIRIGGIYEPTIPPSVTYGITPRMKDIEKVLQDLEQLAMKWKNEEIPSEAGEVAAG